MRQSLHSLKGKIIVRIAILITIEVFLVVSSFGITTYIQSQSTNIGNTINIAGRNRFLTSNFLLELEKVNEGNAQLGSLKNASDTLANNILVLKLGGKITSPSGDIFLMPLSSKYLDKWNEINEKQIMLERYVALFPATDAVVISTNIGSIAAAHVLSVIAASPAEILSDKSAIEKTAAELIISSDDLTRQLGNDARANSQNLVLMQTAFIIGIVIVSGIILFVVKRLLRPISLIIEATTGLKSGNFSIPPIKHSEGNDEVSVLVSSFNSMVEELGRYDQIQKHFISIASHELRSPLQPILGLSDALRVKLSKNNSEDRELADAIFSNAKRLQNTIDNVLQVTKIERQLANFNKESLDICKLIRLLVRDSQYQIKASGKNIQLLLLEKNGNSEGGSAALHDDSTTHGIMVNADRTGLNQVFTNLLNNAIKSMTEGTISISITKQSDTKSTSMSNRQVVVAIRDTGTGISPEMFPKLFTKFGTESETGTGLGLYVSKNIIEGHGGKIWAENNSDGRGATFLFGLPINNFEKPKDEQDINSHESTIS